MSRSKPAKSSAADRTVDMFAHAPIVAEVLPDEVKAARVPLEEDADRMREKAFVCQDWSTKYFGRPDAEGNQYRMSFRGEHYYLETLSKLPHGDAPHAYSGLMIHERDLYSVANVIVAAARSKKDREKECL